MGYITYISMTGKHYIPETDTWENVVPLPLWATAMDDLERELLETQWEYRDDTERYVSGNYKWYSDVLAPLARVSEKFPSVLFKIEGSGEESDDIWVEFWFGGRSMRVHLAMEPPEFSLKAWEKLATGEPEENSVGYLEYREATK